MTVTNNDPRSIPDGEVAVSRTCTKVVHIITALGTGGAERQLQSLVRYSGSDSSTIALYDGGMVAEAMLETGYQVSVLGLASRHGLGKLTALVKLVRMIRAEAPDVVHVHLLAAQLWGIPAARLAGVKHVISSEHSLMDTTIENRPLTPLLRGIYRVLEKMSSHTIAVSPTTKDRLLKWQVRAERISVVNNGIDFGRLTFSADHRRDLRAQWQLDDNAVVVGAVGRLEPVKRFPELLTALAPWLLGGDRHLVIVGTGPLQDELQAIAAAQGVSHRVKLLGARDDVPALLSAMDVVVSPSRDETFGMAVIEAIGAGLPVVYAQCPALEDLGAAPPHAFPLADFGSALESEDAREATAIVAAVDAALVDTPAGGEHRWPVPPAVSTAYGIESAAAAIDSIYGQFSTTGGSA